MNPARELHAILTEWQLVPGGTSVFIARTGSADGDGDLEGYARLIRASRLLGEVERSLDVLEEAGEDVESFRAFVPAWWNAVYLPDTNWSATASYNMDVIGWDTLATLRMLAGFLDKTRIRPYTADLGSFESARDANRQIIETLRAQEDIEPDEKQYVFELLDQIRSLLDAEDLRVSTDLIKRVNELRGWLAAYEDYLEDKEPGNVVVKKLKKAAKLLVPRGKLLFGAGGYVLGVTADVLSLTTGAGPGS